MYKYFRSDKQVRNQRSGSYIIPARSQQISAFVYIKPALIAWRIIRVRASDQLTVNGHIGYSLVVTNFQQQKI